MHNLKGGLIKYTVFNYRTDPRQWEFFDVIGEIRVFEGRHEGDKSYFILQDNFHRERYIRELIPAAGNRNDGLVKGNILASIDDDKLWYELLIIAKKEGILD